jgi:hypothetical protein
MIRISTTLQILALAELVAKNSQNSRELRIILPTAAVGAPRIVARVQAAYAALAV